MIEKLIKTKEEWKNILNPLQYHIMVEGGTEPPFDNEYDKFDEKGEYHCAACDLPLFTSDAKYDSGTGWPSFYGAISQENIIRVPISDYAEALCARCELHLGHVFSDGPKPTGERFCMNSVVLKFYPKE
jgi:peptide-methionine (R)-S-oxide reductase